MKAIMMQRKIADVSVRGTDGSIVLLCQSSYPRHVTFVSQTKWLFSAKNAFVATIFSLV